MSSNQSGFTLVEIVVTAGIVATIGTFAALAIPPALESYRLNQATASLAGALREAQVQALGEGRMWRVTLDADGKGYGIEYAADSALATSKCNSAGWSQWKSFRFHDTVGVAMRSRPCVTFSPSGRAAWPNPQILTGSSETDAPLAGVRSLPRLVDGNGAAPDNPVYDPEAVVWDRYGSPENPVRISIDMLEERYFDTICLGLFSSQVFDYFGYPWKVHVQAAPDGAYPPGTWTPVLDSSGPLDPVGGAPERTCMQVPLNAAYRYFRITMWPTGDYVILDEVEAGDLKFSIESSNRTRTILVDPVTGHVGVR